MRMGSEKIRIIIFGVLIFLSESAWATHANRIAGGGVGQGTGAGAGDSGGGFSFRLAISPTETVQACLDPPNASQKELRIFEQGAVWAVRTRPVDACPNSETKLRIQLDDDPSAPAVAVQNCNACGGGGGHSNLPVSRGPSAIGSTPPPPQCGDGNLDASLGEQCEIGHSCAPLPGKTVSCTSLCQCLYVDIPPPPPPPPPPVRTGPAGNPGNPTGPGTGTGSGGGGGGGSGNPQGGGPSTGAPPPVFTSSCGDNRVDPPETCEANDLTFCLQHPHTGQFLAGCVQCQCFWQDAHGDPNQHSAPGVIPGDI